MIRSAKRTVSVHLHAALDPLRRWTADPPWLITMSYEKHKLFIRHGYVQIKHIRVVFLSYY